VAAGGCVKSDRALGVLMTLLVLTAAAFATLGNSLTAFLFFGCLAILLVALFLNRKG